MKMPALTKGDAAVWYVQVAALLSVMLIASGCAADSHSARITRHEPVSDVLSVPVPDLLARIRTLALSDDPADPAVYEPLLGLVSEQAVGSSARTITTVRWASRGLDEQPIASTVDRIAPRPPERHLWAVLVRLLPPSTYPCITLQDVFAVFGTEYRIPIISLQTAPPGSSDTTAGLPFLIQYQIRPETVTALDFQQRLGCVVVIAIRGRIV